ncbi:MAG TPA: histidine kinase dimerization/phospho-acceptor domain-containing protein [Candidatus Sulfotelmatobacter sp.]|nr:histidine kinase dimerization/phospho-acceptor domain-containing protein [Candidatus Sulfotelmatobacter sp.]
MFWSLIAMGVTFWLAYQMFWTYYEVWLRRDVPDLCAWDVVLFLHMVPLMAALGIRPQFSRDEYSARVGRLDFALLLVWWFYLYVLIVMPWQYVVPDVPAYNRHLNDVYVAEKLVLLTALLASWIASKGEWRRIYAWLFGMSFCYSGASTLCNWAIARKTYYTGSFFDIPLFAAMASLTWVALRTKAENLESDAYGGSSAYGVWVARCSMIAVFSLPLFAVWAMSDEGVPSKVRMFRVSLTLMAAFSMGVIILIRQRILDRELVRLLDHSRAAIEQLQRLQAQVLQSEKLASIGQLVGGAAHELNNPITAMLGYSDLLLNTPLSAEQKPMAAKIGQYVRRTKSLVASLISFARQAPAPKAPLDLNTLARTAVKLTEPHWKALEFDIQTNFDAALPKVLGDSNQLLQVCLQLIGNCLHVSGERGGNILTVGTEQNGGTCVLEIVTQALPAVDAEQKPMSSPLDPEDALGMSACQGILQEHRGRVFRERREDGSLLLCMELPIAVLGPATEKVPTTAGMWQSQPYA